MMVFPLMTIFKLLAGAKLIIDDRLRNSKINIRSSAGKYEKACLHLYDLSVKCVFNKCNTVAFILYLCNEK